MILRHMLVILDLVPDRVIKGLSNRNEGFITPIPSYRALQILAIGYTSSLLISVHVMTLTIVQLIPDDQPDVNTIKNINFTSLDGMPYAGCVLLRRTSATHFQLDDMNRPGTSFIIHGRQLDAYLNYDRMLHEGRQGMTSPIGYNQFVQIFNSAPGVTSNFTYLLKGQKTVTIVDPGPARTEF
jgi:hypothetical protein